MSVFRRSLWIRHTFDNDKKNVKENLPAQQIVQIKSNCFRVCTIGVEKRPISELRNPERSFAFPHVIWEDETLESR